ncbi:MAG: hypothetical protein JXA60_05340 [Candidatus Coatesbacteria bacterium]|nr:hypothetical protein [Candidatus Coatesbacteria bacterium]
MSNEIIHNYDRNTKKADALFCPLIKEKCLQEDCMWWVTDWMENKSAYQHHCAIPLIAEGLNNEDLLKSK